MREIQIVKWKEGIGSNEVERSIIDAFTVLLKDRSPEKIPRGLEKFKIFGRLSAAFDNAKETNKLVLEEREYEFLKKLITDDIPSFWALNKDILTEIENFLSAREVPV